MSNTLFFLLLYYLKSMNQPMNPQVKEKWVNALRSGNYKQTTGNLYESEVGYCCLGVLTDLYLKEKGLEWDTNAGMSGTNMSGWMCFDSEYEFLPESVRDWAGLEDNCGTYEDDVIEGGFICLSGINDNGASFIELADVIESKF